MLHRRFLNDARSLIAAVSDASQPHDGARTVGVYRFWRDCGFVVGALIAGFGADAASTRAAISIVALLIATSSLAVAATGWQARASLNPAPVEGGRRWQATARF